MFSFYVRKSKLKQMYKNAPTSLFSYLAVFDRYFNTNYFSGPRKYSSEAPIFNCPPPSFESIMTVDIPDSTHHCTLTFPSILSSFFFIMSTVECFFGMGSERKKSSLKCMLQLTASVSYGDFTQSPHQLSNNLLINQLLFEYLCWEEEGEDLNHRSKLFALL